MTSFVIRVNERGHRRLGRDYWIGIAIGPIAGGSLAVALLVGLNLLVNVPW